MIPETALRKDPLRHRTAWVLALVLLVFELGAIGLTYKHAIGFICLDNWPAWACRGASMALASVYTLFGALVLYFLLRRSQAAELFSDAGRDLRPLILNLAGLAVALVPLALLRQGDGTRMLWAALVLWVVGFGLLLAGLVLLVAPVHRLRRLFSESGGQLLAVVAAGSLAPVLAAETRPMWRLDAITDMTFAAVAWIVRRAGYDIQSYPDEKVIGADGFFIHIAQQCSGVEGITLVTLFVTIYLVLFRRELRFPRVLWLYPAGILASMVLNIVRIALLLMIGLEGRPELAVGGFHSHAGWLMFTLAAFGIIYVARSLPGLQKTAPDTALPGVAAPLPPLSQDANAARILPFAVFMFSALLAQVFSQNPALVYPLRVCLMLAALVLFRQVYAALPRRPSALSLAVGAAIGAMWVLVPYQVADSAPPFGQLSGGGLAIWMVARGFGTIVLVPLIEELFFRDYLEGRLRPLFGPVLAACIGAALFAALHDRWAEAFVAGLALSWVMSRRHRLADAVAAHAVANAIVFAVALILGDFHII
ncbi:exosortase E/protease, VPEID-CTERM system [Tropicimonas sp.]|uniref:exosortase E/protease, VPEID-CTERM system n=1 Tax=Tropicimonas sp. TaxID=2067044 RepID=UPI003A8750B5